MTHDRTTHPAGDAPDVQTSSMDLDEAPPVAQHDHRTSRLAAGSTGPSHRDRAQTLFRQRRDRVRWFGEHAKLFQDPTWGILLELFLCGEDGHAPSTTSIAYGTAVPTTTTLRTLGRLEESGLVESWTDTTDSRVRRVRMTEEAICMMREYLDNV